MKRPEWAAAGTFAEAWRTAEDQLADYPEDFDSRFAVAFLRGMAQAHVIAMSKEQVAVLPYMGDIAAADFFRELRLPFQTIYLSLDEASLLRVSDDGAAKNDVDAWVRGALIGPNVLMPCMLASYEGSRIPVYHQCSVSPNPDGAGWRVAMPEHLANYEGGLQISRVAAWSANLCMTALYLLESSNVELVDGEASRRSDTPSRARAGGSP